MNNINGINTEINTGINGGVSLKSGVSPSVKDGKTDEIKSNIDLFSKEIPLQKDEKGFIDHLKTLGKKGSGVTLGFLLDSAYSTSGLSTLLHEHGHGTMVRAFFTDPKIEIQVDAVDNIKNFTKNPTMENAEKVINHYDVNQDKAAGMTRFETGEKATLPAYIVGGKGVSAVISAAGCVAEEIPTFVGFALGYKMRKESPVLGYALMSMATVHHLNTSLYPFSAMMPSIASTPGHDWTAFAQATGIPPLATAVAFASSLPLLGYFLHKSEEKQKEKELNRQAVARLIQNGGISSQELETAFNSYENKEKIESAQDKLAKQLDTPVNSLEDKSAQKNLKKAITGLKKEFDGFSDYLAEKFPDKVGEEVKKEPPAPKKSFGESVQDMKRSLVKSWNEDKVGTALATASIAGNTALAMGTTTATAALLSGMGGITIALTSALIPAVPVVSALGSASTVYTAGKTLRNPDADKLDKATAVSSALFSSLTTAGLLIAGGAPVALIGVAGMLGTMGVKALIKKFRD